MSLDSLIKRLDDRSAKVAVVGLGYVGFSVACAFAEAGFEVIGLERRADRVEKINAGVMPIEGAEPGLAELLTRVRASGKLVATTKGEDLARADVVLVAVDTPVASDHRPRYEAMRAACRSIGMHMKDGALVIIESTVAPGTTMNVVRPLLERYSKKALGTGFYLGHCPERVMPGRLLQNLKTLSRVCGGATPETARAMTAFYKHVVRGELDVADCVTAEIVKTGENAFRDVNIAFANELALVCEGAGADFRRVRELVNKSPGRNVLMAGAGVGGHCIPKDPWLLMFGSPELRPRVIAAARHANDAMPLHVARLVEDELERAGVSIDQARIALLGFSYLENSDDTRNSPTAMVKQHLTEWGAQVVVTDPWVPELQGDPWEAIAGADAAVLMVAHDVYRGIDLARLKRVLRTPILVDGRHVFEAEDAKRAGLTFRALGRARPT